MEPKLIFPIFIFSILGIITSTTCTTTTSCSYDDSQFYPCFCNKISVASYVPFTSVICQKPLHDQNGAILIPKMKYLVMDQMVIADAFWNTLQHSNQNCQYGRCVTSPLLMPQLSGFRIRDLTVRNGNLKSTVLFETGYFREQGAYLTRLTLSNCSFAGPLPELTALISLSKLEFLDLSRNNLTQLFTLTFLSTSRTLKELYLQRNFIHSIEKNTFVNLTALEVLDISHNKLTEIDANIFPAQNSSLQKLNFGYNEIYAIDAQLFHNLKHLEELHIEFNFLHQIPQDLWILNAIPLKFVNLSGNFVYCGCHMKLQSTNSNNSLHVEGICQAPESLSGFSISQISTFKCEEVQIR